MEGVRKSTPEGKKPSTLYTVRERSESGEFYEAGTADHTTDGLIQLDLHDGRRYYIVVGTIYRVNRIVGFEAVVEKYPDEVPVPVGVSFPISKMNGQNYRRVFLFGYKPYRKLYVMARREAKAIVSQPTLDMFE